MKTTTFAAAGLSLASLATAVPLCAINCFQSVVTEHPPLDCTEPNMYLCFCKSDSLQQYFIDCAYSDCGSDSDAAEAIAFGVDTCEDLGAPITIPTGPPAQSTPPPAGEPTPSGPPAEPSSEDEPTPEPTESGSAVEPTESSTDSAPADPSDTAAPGGDDEDEEPPVTVSLADGMHVSGLVLAAGIAVALFN